MATELAFLEDSFTAAADLSSYQHRIVRLNGSGKITYAAAATHVSLGVLQDKPNGDGRAGLVRLLGISKVEAGALVAENALITSDSSGRGVTASPAGGVNNYVIGRAITAAGAAGDKFDVLLAPCIKQG